MMFQLRIANRMAAFFMACQGYVKTPKKCLLFWKSGTRLIYYSLIYGTASPLVAAEATVSYNVAYSMP